jgi:hypothetical protein
MIHRSVCHVLLAVVATATCATPALADVPGHGRAWELVTLSEPVGGTPHEVVDIADNGERLAYYSVGPMPGALAGDAIANNLATRNAGGWSTVPISFPYRVEEIGVLAVLRFALSDDLLTSIWSSTAPLVPGGPPPEHIGWYRRDRQGNVELLADTGTEDESLFRGASADTGTVVIGSTNHLLPSDAGRAKGHSIYELGNGTLRQVDVDTSGNLLSSCGSEVAKMGGVSRDGERIFFTNPAPGISDGCGEPTARVYLRSGGATTVEISSSQCTRPDCDGDQPAHFVGATPTGGAAFIASAQQLTNDDIDAGLDLYRYETASGDLIQLSAASGGETGDATGNPVRASEDGSRVYFHSQGRLLPGQGSADGENLYLEEGSDLRFVAPSLGNDPLQISADGRIALFETAAPLVESDGDEQVDVYRFDAVSGAVTQLSIGAAGGNGPIDATIEGSIGLEPPVLQPVLRPALSQDGEHLFFSTSEALLPMDQGDGVDVYEWSGGTVGLVSAGAGSADARFLAVSADGGTVAFKTAATLLGGDRDGGDFDIYVARIGGGFAEAATVPDCFGGKCGPELAGRAGRSAPVTALASGRSSRGRISLKRLDRDAGARLSASGKLMLTVSVPAPGRLSATATIAAGSGRKTIARGIAGAARPGELRIGLRATPAAGVLSHVRALQTRILLRQGHVRLVRNVLLRGAPS